MEKFFGWVEKIVKVIGILSLLGMILCIAFNVLVRILFESSLVWAEEYAYLLFCYAVFFGTIIIYDKKEIISINAILILLPKAVQKFVFYFNRMLLVLINAALTYLTIRFAIQGASKFTPMMRIPYSIIDASIALMFFFITLYSIRDLVYAITKRDVMEVERRTE